MNLLAYLSLLDTILCLPRIHTHIRENTYTHTNTHTCKIHLFHTNFCTHLRFWQKSNFPSLPVHHPSPSVDHPFTTRRFPSTDIHGMMWMQLAGCKSRWVAVYLNQVSSSNYETWIKFQVQVLKLESCFKFKFWNLNQVLKLEWFKF